MSPEEIESYLSNIEEYVFDEKKIVTYNWLSKTLGIHSNVSKQLLYTFFQDNPKKDELCATYILIGIANNGDTYQVLIVKDKDLQEVESSLKTITSKHVYSIQKCTELSDLNVLFAAQKGESIDSISKGISAIDFNCTERDNAMIEKLRFNALPAVSNQPTGLVKKVNPPPSNKNKSPIKSEETVKSTKSEESKESSDKTGNEKTVIPSMFKNNKSNTGPKKKTAEKVSVNNKNSKGIGAFFSKTTKPINEPKPAADKGKHGEEKSLDNEVKESLSALKENKATLNIRSQDKSDPKLENSTEEIPIKLKKADSQPKKAVKKVDSKRNKKAPVKKVVKEEKKRKRLVVLSDSDSDNSSEGEEEVVREPTPEPEPTVIPDNGEDMEEDVIYGTPEPSSRKRKKKLVSKTFVSSEGYMVTEKQLVDASCSEDEEVVAEKKFKPSTTEDESVAIKSNSASDVKPVKSTTEKKVSPKEKTTSPQKTKQASLMSFFKKK